MIDNLKLGDGRTIDRVVWVKDGVGHEIDHVAFGTGGQPPVDPPPSGTPSAGLFYAMPADIQQQPKKVFAHYFGPYPRSVDNASTEAGDTYSRVWNNPDGNGAAVTFYNRPMFRPQQPAGWQVADCKFDIITAYNAGLDGFVCDLLGLSGGNYDNYENLKTALRQLRSADSKYNNFYVNAMIDCNGSTGAAAYTTAGDYVLTFSDVAWHLPDGRMFWSAFKATEGATSTYLKQVGDYMALKGYPNAFGASLTTLSQLSEYYSWGYAAGPWGYGADPKIVQAAGNYVATVHSGGIAAFSPIVAQDTRPNSSGLWDEASNTGCLRATLTKVINEGADLAQLVTWSDFSETPSTVSTQRGYCVLDVAGYYLTRWKTGAYPDILEDALYLSHREAPVAATAQAGPVAQHWSRGNMSDPQDSVEVLSYLTAPADITVTVGGTPTTYTAPAGEYVKTLPLAVGPAPSVVAKRGGAAVAQVTSTCAVTNSPYFDDKGYWWFSSIRGTAGQQRHPGPNPPFA